MAENDIPKDDKNIIAEEIGSIKITDDVVSIVAGIAATEVVGVAGMSGGIAGGIAEILGKKNLSKGVKVSVTDKQATIDLFIIVDYGCRIPDIAWEIQDKVKKAVETMTGLNVTEVNIHVQGVYIEKDNKKDQAEELPCEETSNSTKETNKASGKTGVREEYSKVKTEREDQKRH